MRTVLTAGLLAALALPLAAVACGGGTPPPNDESSAKSGDDTKGAGSSAPADSAEPAKASGDEPSAAPVVSSASASSSSSASASSAGAGSSASGDIKPPADDPWLASHQMPPKDVMKTMKGAQGKVQACFKAGLKRDPSTSGEVKIRFVVTNDGAVRAWKDDASSMSDGDVTQCVGEVLNKQKFPKQKSPGDAWGSYSIHFGP